MLNWIRCRSLWNVVRLHHTHTMRSHSLLTVPSHYVIHSPHRSPRTQRIRCGTNMDSPRPAAILKPQTWYSCFVGIKLTNEYPAVAVFSLAIVLQYAVRTHDFRMFANRLKANDEFQCVCRTWTGVKMGTMCRIITDTLPTENENDIANGRQWIGEIFPWKQVYPFWLCPRRMPKRIENKRKSVVRSSTIIASTIRSPFIITWIGLGAAFESCTMQRLSWARFVSTLNVDARKLFNGSAWMPCLVLSRLTWNATYLRLNRAKFVHFSRSNLVRVFSSSSFCMKNASTAQALMRQLVTLLNPELRSTSREQMRLCGNAAYFHI